MDLGGITGFALAAEDDEVAQGTSSSKSEALTGLGGAGGGAGGAGGGDGFGGGVDKV